MAVKAADDAELVMLDMDLSQYPDWSQTPPSGSRLCAAINRMLPHLAYDCRLPQNEHRCVVFW